MTHYAPVVHRTKHGTPYLTEPGLALIAQTQFDRQAIRPFLESFGDLFSVDNYIDDQYLQQDPDIEALPDGEALAKYAGQECYLSFGEKRTRNKDADKYFDNIKAQAHGSLFQHVNYTMQFYGIDRSVTHELVRHSAGFGFSQVSQRYVDGKALRFVCRPEYVGNDKLMDEFESSIDDAAYRYDKRVELLTAAGIGADLPTATERRKARNQAARACLPNETEAPIVVTANVRGWRNFIEQRASKHADRPIRALAYRALTILKEAAPLLFNDYTDDGPDAVTTLYRKV